MIQHSIPANLAALSDIRQLVTLACQNARLSEEATYRLALAVDEIATNIITHGYEEQGLSGRIGVSIERTDQSLTVVLEDTGAAYDPRTQSLPTAEDLDRPLEDREIGGLGIFLALQGVDCFDYQRSNNVNRNIFGMNLA
ncbi:MAG: anti-sigma regulatory factor [Candidatus Contendobacter sp.]|nr:MAG: anti-sigma regulatory factor [Candidatus Contendobacter sp.]